MYKDDVRRAKNYVLVDQCGCLPELKDFACGPGTSPGGSGDLSWQREYGEKVWWFQ